jgi:hypothetical protein
VTSKERCWVLKGGTAQEISISRPQALPEGATAATPTRNLLPPKTPSGEARPGRFLPPPAGRHSTFAPAFREDLVYFIAEEGQRSTVLVYQPGAAAWKVLTDGMPAIRLPRQQNPIGAEVFRRKLLRQSALFHASSLENLALYTPDGGESGRIALYDGNMEREITVQACPQGVGVRRVSMIDGGGAPRIPLHIVCRSGAPPPRSNGSVLSLPSRIRSAHRSSCRPRRRTGARLPGRKDRALVLDLGLDRGPGRQGSPPVAAGTLNTHRPKSLLPPSRPTCGRLPTTRGSVPLHTNQRGRQNREFCRPLPSTGDTSHAQ